MSLTTRFGTRETIKLLSKIESNVSSLLRPCPLYKNKSTVYIKIKVIVQILVCTK